MARFEDVYALPQASNHLFRMILTASKWFDSPRTLKLAGFGLLLALSLGLRLYRLNTYSPWLDETIQYGYANHPVDRIMTNQDFADWTFLPVLITRAQILAHFDADAWQLRLPYVLFGVGTVFAIFLLAREMFTERVAWISAFLAAIWPRLIEYSQELRAYALFALLASVAGFALLRALRTTRAEYWALFVVACLLEIYNHLLGILNVASFVVFSTIWALVAAIGSIRQYGNFWQGVKAVSGDVTRMAAAFVVIGVGFLPVLGSYLRAGGHPGLNSRGSLRLNGESIAMIFGSYLGLGTGFALVVLCALSLIGFGYACLRFPRAAGLGITWLALPLSFAVLSSGGNAFKRSPRYALFLLPVILPVVAAGMVQLAEATGALAARLLKRSTPSPRLSKGFLVIIVTVIIGLATPVLVSLYRNNPKPLPVDLRSAYQYILKRATKDDVLLGLGEPGFWITGWFPFTDMYFLRQSASPPVSRVIPVGTDADYAPVPFSEIDAKKGKLFAIVVMRPSLKPKLDQAAEGIFITKCWENVCAVESISHLPMSSQLDDFFSRFTLIDPIRLKALFELRHQNALPPPSNR